MTMPTYLGDGVYASFDGYHVWLATERDGQKHTIAIEPDVWEELSRYIALVKDAIKKDRIKLKL